jgi:putative PEP-CTERM system TPR-repeat lipoprotein
MGEQALVERAAKERDNGDLRAAMLDLKNALKKNPANVEARLALGEVTLATGDFSSAIRELEVARDGGIPADRVRLPLAKAYLSGGRLEDALKVIGTSTSGPHAAELLATRGVALLGLQRMPEARESFDRALKTDPKNVEALMGIATGAADTESLPAALAITDRALQVDANDPRIHILRGQLQLRAQAPALAQKEFATAVQDAEKRKQGDQRFVALAGQAEAAMAQGHADDSLAVTQRMTELRPEHPLTRFMRARALLLAGRPAEARPLLEKNVGQNPDANSSKVLLGAIALGDGTFGQAEMYLSSVINAEPGNVIARQLLAAARLKQRKSADALAALLPGVAADNPNAQLLAAAGKVSIAAGDTAAGLDYLERSVKADPNDVMTRLNLAAGYLAGGQADKAAALLDSLPEQGGNAPQRRYLKALTFLAKGDKAGAIQFVTSTADTESKDSTAQMLAGSLLASQQDFARARTYFERVIALKPETTAAYLSIARLDLMQGHPDAARAELTRAMEKSKGDPLASLAMADFEVTQHRPDQALAVLDAALKARPTFIEGRAREIQILLGTGKLERADTVAQDGVRLAPNLAASQRMLGDVRMAQKKYSEAATAYQKASATEPSATLAMRQFEALRLGSLRDPLAPLQKLVDQQPKDLGARFALAQAAQELGDRKTAIRAYQELDQARPNNPAVLNNLAWLKYEDRDPAALGLAKRAHDAAPKDPRITDTYGWLLVEGGQVKEGLALLASIADESADEQFRMHYAQALARAGRRAEARELSARLASSTSPKISDQARRLVQELDRG